MDSGAQEQHERSALNSREAEVLRLLVQGLANKEIASHTEMSESGVKKTLQQLFAKTDVRTRTSSFALLWSGTGICSSGETCLASGTMASR